MEITNPRRILAVSSADATQHLSRVIKDLTGTPPEPTAAGPSLAGTTHNLALNTAYYTAEVPIWLDLIASPSEWAASFLSPEAKEVLEVLGGVVVVFSLPTSPSSGDGAHDLIRNIGRVVREGLGGWEWDGVSLCVGVGEIDDVDEWEDCCAEWGLEFVQVRGQHQSAGASDRNEFGEKTGIPRILEALESNDWSQALGPGEDDDFGSEFGDFEEGLTKGAGGGGGKETFPSTTTKRTDLDDDGTDLDPESLDFGFDREDFAGLRRAIWTAGRDDDNDDDNNNNEADLAGGQPGNSNKVERETGGEPGGGEDGDEDEVRKLERMMVKLQAVRDMSAGLPDDQRKRMAARAVNEVMKEL
ncbi:putative alpha and gamma adaptin binding protein p34 protein [Eutypa lata UCREL1]|uniref:Putative alpha and gamma adaptin binding protein p34 protein n=1 Tax=Eutypa lata (strain UCR-EL1) TaxID=1287681 RepID=M7T205_EUTLA|nr:putative alpha and gamma adaptin binding protein p34 protein [Eutypa lata UCREL1]